MIIDRETKEKIPFVNIWLENESIGTTSDLNGAFELDIQATKVLVFSAIGYETTRISSDSIKSIVELNPASTELGEIVVTATDHTLTQTIGEIRKSKINSYFSCGGSPWIAARYFEYNEAYSKTQFLEKVKVLTKSNIQDARFNLRLYKVDSKGKPGDYLFDKNIIGIAGKGKKLTEVDLSELYLEFPREGLFIAIEWLIIDENAHQYLYTKQGSAKKLEGISFEPSIGTVSTDTDENSWLFIGGRWMNPPKNNFGNTKKHQGKYGLVAIELTLTN